MKKLTATLVEARTKKKAQDEEDTKKKREALKVYLRNLLSSVC